MFCHSLKPTGIVITTEHSWMEKHTKFGQSILSKIKVCLLLNGGLVTPLDRNARWVVALNMA